MEKNNLQELVSRALDYEKPACLELAAWYRKQGNADMAEHFEKKAIFVCFCNVGGSKQKQKTSAK